MKLTLGSILLGGDKTSYQFLELQDGDNVVDSFKYEEIFQPELGVLSAYRYKIDEFVVGFLDFELDTVDFLQYLPHVKKVWILTSKVKNIDGLHHLNEITNLTIERPTCRMDVLGELPSLKQLYLDDWRPGAKSVFNLNNLVDVGIQKFQYPNLTNISHWSHLEELWLNAGKLEKLTGIPQGIKKLRLTNLRKLRSLLPLDGCRQIQDLRVEGCREIETLQGIESCTQLQTLSIAKTGNIQSLEPLRNLKKLEYIVFAGKTAIGSANVDALYGLPRLKTLIISKHSRIDPKIVIKTAPSCNIRLTTG